MTNYEKAIEDFILTRIPNSSERTLRKLSLYASNNLRLCGNPSPDSVEFKIIVRGIVNAAILGSEENI